MKVKYLIPFLVLVFIFGFGLFTSCKAEKIIEEEIIEEPIEEEVIPKEIIEEPIVEPTPTPTPMPTSGGGGSAPAPIAPSISPPPIGNATSTEL